MIHERYELTDWRFANNVAVSTCETVDSIANKERVQNARDQAQFPLEERKTEGTLTGARKPSMTELSTKISGARVY